MNNEVVLYQESAGVANIPNTNNVNELMNFNKSLPQKDAEKIVKAYNNKLFDMAAEYIWSRTVNTLKKNLLRFGDEFLAEMLDRPDITSIDNISEYEIIKLSSDLGFINKTAKIEFFQFSEIIQHYMSNEEPDEEFPITKSSDIVRSCIKHVLGYENVDYEISFVLFRDRLKSEHIDEEHEIVEQLKYSPYFYKRTVNKTLLNLAKTTKDSAEREIIMSNLICIIPSVWKDLSSEDKWSVGRTYAQSTSEGDKKFVIALKAVLLKVKGFDFVPENLRSNAYISAAKGLLGAHYGVNNFYNEPSKAKFLSQMGQSIPAPAFGSCMTAILACKLGNAYGISWEAQSYLDDLLKNITIDRWNYYMNSVFLTDETIVYKLRDYAICERWIEIINQYKVYEIDLSLNRDVKELLENSKKENISKIIKIASKIAANM